MYHIVINPASRSGKGLEIWQKEVEPILVSEQVTYRSYLSKEAGDVSNIIRNILTSVSERPVSIILLGGDGTVNEALQGMEDTTGVILGYIPTGSGNDFARDLGLPKNPVEALRLILRREKIRAMDLGTIEYGDGIRHRFAVSHGIGFDAAVCEEITRSNLKKVLSKVGLSKLTYLLIALKQLFAARQVSCKLTLDDQEPIHIKRLLFLTGMLHRYEGGGFMFCPNADASDGLLDLCVVGDIPKLVCLLALPTAFKGKHYFVKGITPYRAKKIQVETSAPLWLHTDGEVWCQTTSLTVTCQQQAIQMIGF